MAGRRGPRTFRGKFSSRPPLLEQQTLFLENGCIGIQRPAAQFAGTGEREGFPAERGQRDQETKGGPGFSTVQQASRLMGTASLPRQSRYGHLPLPGADFRPSRRRHSQVAKMSLLRLTCSTWLFPWARATQIRARWPQALGRRYSEVPVREAVRCTTWSCFHPFT